MDQLDALLDEALASAQPAADPLDAALDQAMSRAFDAGAGKVGRAMQVQGTEQLGDLIWGMTIQGAGAYTAAGTAAEGAGAALTPSAMQRRPRLVGPDRLTAGAQPMVDLAGTMAPDQVERKRFDITRQQRAQANQKPLDQRMLEWGARMRAATMLVAEKIPYVRSAGAVGLIEDAAGALPHFAGAIGAGVGGGPAGAAAYLVATEGASQTARVYDNLIAAGVPSDEAQTRATANGVLYSMGSGLLEFVGLNKVMRATGLGRAWGAATEKAARTLPKRVLQRVARGAEAAVVEGSTEVLQGILGDTMNGWATGDWDRFRSEWANMDVRGREFIVGALLGGGVVAAGSIVDPTLYQTPAQWLEAQRQAAKAAPDSTEAGASAKQPEQQRAEPGQQGQQAEPEDQVDGQVPSQNKPAEGTAQVPAVDLVEGGGPEATIETQDQADGQADPQAGAHAGQPTRTPAPAQGIRPEQRVRLPDGTETTVIQTVGDFAMVDGSETGIPLSDLTPVVDSGDGQTGRTGGEGLENRGTPAAPARDSWRVRQRVPESRALGDTIDEVVRANAKAAGQRAAGRLAIPWPEAGKAVPDAVVSARDTAWGRLGERLGVGVIEASGLDPAYSGFRASNGWVVVNKSLSSQKKQAVVLHEFGHEMWSWSADYGRNLANAVKGSLPGLWDKVTGDYKARYEATSGQALPADLATEEGLTNIMEVAADLVIEAERQAPGWLRQLANAKPRVFMKIWSNVQRFLRHMGLYQGPVRIERFESDRARARAAFIVHEGLKEFAKLRDQVRGQTQPPTDFTPGGKSDIAPTQPPPPPPRSAGVQQPARPAPAAPEPAAPVPTAPEPSPAPAPTQTMQEPAPARPAQPPRGARVPEPADPGDRRQAFRESARFGRRATIQLADGRALGAQYVAVEAEDLTPSHDARRQFVRNEHGDPNERPYHDAKEARGSRATVEKIASDPKPDLLYTDTPTPVDGPPIVSREGVVYGGNARTMGVQLAYHRGGEAAERLRAAAGQAASKFGVSVDDLRNPVIVRMVDGEWAPGELSRVLNDALSAGKSGATDAVSRAGKVSNATDELVSALMLDGDEEVSLRAVMSDPKKATRLVQAFVRDGVFNDKDIESYVDQNDTLTEAGKDIIERVLLGRVIDDVSTLAEMTPAVRNKIMGVMGPMRRAIESDSRVKTWLFTAVQAFRGYKAAKSDLVPYFFEQQYMMPPPGYQNPVVAALVKGLDERGPRQLKQDMGDLLDRLGVTNPDEVMAFARIDPSASPMAAVVETFAPELASRMGPDVKFSLGPVDRAFGDEIRGMRTNRAGALAIIRRFKRAGRAFITGKTIDTDGQVVLEAAAINGNEVVRYEHRADTGWKEVGRRAFASPSAAVRAASHTAMGEPVQAADIEPIVVALGGDNDTRSGPAERPPARPWWETIDRSQIESRLIQETARMQAQFARPDVPGQMTWADLEDESDRILFSLFNPDEDRGIFGQRTFDRVTGRQQGLAFPEESAVQRADRLAREAKPTDTEGQTNFVGDPEAKAAAAKVEAAIADPKMAVKPEDVGRQQLMFSLAYHGSAARFDRFSTAFMGTGEGSQAFGWGLYFASRREVARWYKERLEQRLRSDPDFWDRVRPTLPPNLTNEEWMRYIDLVGELNNKNKSPTSKAPTAALLAEFQVLADKKRAYEEAVEAAKPRGALYQVDLKPAEDEYLLWDEPLSRQSEKVRTAMESLNPYIRKQVDDWFQASASFGRVTKRVERLVSDVDMYEVYQEDDGSFSLRYTRSDGRGGWTVVGKEFESAGDAMAEGRRRAGRPDVVGSHVYARLQQEFDSAKTASARLLSAGIRGIKYKDGSSRTQKAPGQGSTPKDMAYNAMSRPGATAETAAAHLRSMLSDDLPAGTRSRIEQAIRHVEDGSWNRWDTEYNYVIFDEQDVEIQDVMYALAGGDQTETANFKRWFGKSKVVDADGKPLRLYHGTRRDFSQFDVSDEGDAGHFGTAEQANMRTSTLEGSRLLPVYLSIENPVRLRDTGKDWTARIARARRAGRDGIVYLNRYEGITTDTILRAQQEGVRLDQLSDQEFRKYVPEARDSWIVFDPTQVKSATANRGTFDPANPDIRFGIDWRALTGRQRPMKDAGRRRTHKPGEGRRPTPGTVDAQEEFFDGFSRPGFGLLRKLRNWVQDNLIALRNMQTAVQMQGGTITDATDAYLQEELSHSRTRRRLERFRREHVEPLVKLIRDLGLSLDEVDLYLYARHAPERNAYIERINPRFREQGIAGSGMSTGEARAIVGSFAAEGKIKKLEQVAAAFDRITKFKLDLQLKEGLITQEEYDAYGLYQAYAPLHSPAEEATLTRPGRIGRGMDMRGEENERALGRVSRAANITASALVDATRAIVRAERAKVGRAFLNFVRENPDSELWEVNTAPVEPRFNPATGIVEYGVPRGWQLADDVLAVKENGVEQHITIKVPELATALKKLDDVGVHLVIRVAGKLMRPLAAMRTSLSPAFVIKNFLRDALTAAANLVGENIKGLSPLRVLAGAPKAVPAIFKELRQPGSGGVWGQHFQDFERDGGRTGLWSYKSAEDTAEELKALIAGTQPGGWAASKRFAGALGQLVEDLNTAVENGVRVSIYVEAKRAGLSMERAASLAKNTTVNFDRRGAWTRGFGSLYLFFNASVQGSTRILHALRTTRGKQMAGAVATSGAMLYLMNYLLAGEDDDGTNLYLAVPEWVRNNNIVIMLPGTDGDYIKLPMPYGYNALHLAGAHSMAVVLGTEKPVKAAGLTALAGLEAFSPVGVSGTSGEDASMSTALGMTFAPTLAEPVLQSALNQSWYGSPIRPEPPPWGAQIPESEMSWSRTPEAFKWASRVLNALTGGDDVRPGAVSVSPETIEHYADFIGASPWVFTKQVVNTVDKLLRGQAPATREIPFLREVYGRPSDLRHRERFYEHVGNMVNAEGWIKTYEESGRSVEADRVRAEFATELAAAPLLKRYRELVTELRKVGDADDLATDALREANRAVRAIEEGGTPETPLLDEHAPMGRSRRRLGE